jgi:hypothetical protein
MSNDPVAAIVAPLAVLIGLLFVSEVFALIDIAKSDFKGKNDKLVWILIVMFFPPLGIPLYALVGRKQKQIAATSSKTLPSRKCESIGPAIEIGDERHWREVKEKGKEKWF